jgi:hypothetical protein
MPCHWAGPARLRLASRLAELPAFPGDAAAREEDVCLPRGQRVLASDRVAADLHVQLAGAVTQCCVEPADADRGAGLQLALIAPSRVVRGRMPKLTRFSAWIRAMLHAMTRRRIKKTSKAVCIQAAVSEGLTAA